MDGLPQTRVARVPYTVLHSSGREPLDEVTQRSLTGISFLFATTMHPTDRCLLM